MDRWTGASVKMPAAACCGRTANSIPRTKPAKNPTSRRPAQNGAQSPASPAVSGAAPRPQSPNPKERLKIPPMNHDELPDVVLYDPEKDWLFLIEAVTSHGPVSPKRHAELERMLRDCPAERVYVTAFLDFTSFRKHAGNIVWESEAWLVENADHMIHYNGAKFLGPYPVG
jgi:hypothetical protein